MTKILCLSGSLRAQSSSRAFARAISARLEPHAEVSTFDIGSLPHYNADLGEPEAVTALKQAIGDADGLVIVTPEYNFSIPGVLKNAIDWASRPGYQSVFKGKPVFVMSVSGGALGGVRAQSHLKYILNGMLAVVFPWQEVIVPQANDKVEDGLLADEAILDFAMDGLTAFLGELAG
jgi:chromate reductase, NAD(P)H dehydrogenase (quinone)